MFHFIISSCDENKESYELEYGYHLKEDGVILNVLKFMLHLLIVFLLLFLMNL